MFKRLLKWLLKLSLIIIFFSAAMVLSVRYFNPSHSALMLERKLSHWQSGQSYNIDREWISYEELPDALKLAVIAAEDQLFPQHTGFDLKAIANAFKRNKSQSQTTFGASTISQQVAKNQFLWSGRSYLRKGVEAWFTFLIESTWSKQRILEVYLNSVEWGDGIFRAQAAAQYYFGKDAAQLTQNQANQLAAILPSPLTRSASKPSAYTRKRADWINQQIHQLGGVHFLSKHDL